MGFIAIGVLVCAPANAQSFPGTATEIVAGTEAASGVNLTMTGAAGDFWYGVEVIDLAGAADETRPGVAWRDVSANDTDTKFFQPYGIVNDGIYPTILTWGANANVIVTGKIDPDLDTGTSNTGEAHLWAYIQDRDDLTASHTSDEVVPWQGSNSGNEHGRPHLARDPEEPEQYLCWTSQTSSSDDLWVKAKDAGTWNGSTQRDLSVTGDTDDHCFMAFNHNGTRYTAYHRDQSSGNDIGLEITSFTGGTWTVIDEGALPSSAGYDKPAMWVHIDGSESSIFVVAQGASGGGMRWWKCEGSQSDCDDLSEFDGPQNLVTSGPTFNPKIIVVPNGSSMDAYVVYEDANSVGAGAANEVHLLRNCGAAFTGVSDWDDVGNLPVPTGYDDANERTTGVFNGSASSQWHWTGSKMHFAYLVATDDDSYFSVVDWRAQPGVDICTADTGDTGP